MTGEYSQVTDSVKNRLITGTQSPVSFYRYPIEEFAFSAFLRRPSSTRPYLTCPRRRRHERKACPQATSDQRPASASFPRQIGIKATVARQISAAAVSRTRTARGGCLTHPVPIGAWQRTRVHGCASPAGDACTFQSALSTMTAPGLQTVISMRWRVRSPASAHAIKELPGNCLTA